MKRKFYIASFIFLGLLLQFIVHAAAEIWYIDLLTDDFARYGLGLSWSNWVMIHNILTPLLIIVGALFGYHQGKFWWRRLYEMRGKV